MSQYAIQLQAIYQLLFAPRHGTRLISVQRREVPAPHRRPKRSALDLLEFLPGGESNCGSPSEPMDVQLTVGIIDGYGQPFGSCVGLPGNDAEMQVINWALAVAARDQGAVVLSWHAKKLLEGDVETRRRSWDMRLRMGVDPSTLGVHRYLGEIERLSYQSSIEGGVLELSRNRGMFESGVVKTLVTEALGRTHDRLVYRVGPHGVERNEEWDGGDRLVVPGDRIYGFLEGHALTVDGPVDLRLCRNHSPSVQDEADTLLASAVLGVP